MEKDMLSRLPPDLTDPNAAEDLTRTIDRMEARQILPEAAEGMDAATSAALGETGGASLGLGPLGLAIGAGVGIGYGIDQIPVGGGNNVGSWLENNVY